MPPTAGAGRLRARRRRPDLGRRGPRRRRRRARARSPGCGSASPRLAGSPQAAGRRARGRLDAPRARRRSGRRRRRGRGARRAAWRGVRRAWRDGTERARAGRAAPAALAEARRRARPGAGGGRRGATISGRAGVGRSRGPRTTPRCIASRARLLPAGRRGPAPPGRDGPPRLPPAPRRGDAPQRTHRERQTAATAPRDPAPDLLRPAAGHRDRAAVVPHAVVAGHVRARAVQALGHLPGGDGGRSRGRLPRLLPLRRGVAHHEHLHRPRPPPAGDRHRAPAAPVRAGQRPRRPAHARGPPLQRPGHRPVRGLRLPRRRPAPPLLPGQRRGRGDHVAHARDAADGTLDHVPGVSQTA